MLSLDELPVEMVAHVASYVDKRYVYKYPLATHDPSELLALRCASRSCNDAVRRAATQHKAVERFNFYGSSAQSIAARGRVFGSGCRILGVCFGDLTSAEAVNSLDDFFNHGQLRELSYTGGSSISMSDLLDICRACPLLTRLNAQHAPITTANIEHFAPAASLACPLLESVHLPCSQSPAEGYQWQFPRLKCLDFSFLSSSGLNEGPTRWDKVEEMIRACVLADKVDLSQATVSPQLVDMILGAPVAGRIKALDLSEPIVISPELILRFARGLEALSDLQLPTDFDGGSDFYRSLVQARPTIKRLALGYGNLLFDYELFIICDGLRRLEYMALVSVERLTGLALDIIVESPCAQTCARLNLLMPLNSLLRVCCDSYAAAPGSQVSRGSIRKRIPGLPSMVQTSTRSMLCSRAAEVNVSRWSWANGPSERPRRHVYCSV